MNDFLRIEGLTVEYRSGMADLIRTQMGEAGK